VLEVKVTASLRKQHDWGDKSQEEIGQNMFDQNLVMKLAENHTKHAKGEIPIEQRHSC
jgi:hypothetical protein